MAKIKATAIFAAFAFIVGVLIYPKYLITKEHVTCDYSEVNEKYSCNLTVYNPGEHDDFKIINGAHQKRKYDSDVLRVYVTTKSSSVNFPSIICKELNNLERIYIEPGGISEIYEITFMNCKWLKVLKIINNKIEQVNENSFKNNQQLKILSLAENKLMELSEDAFINLQKLLVLDLSKNNFEDLPTNIFRPLMKLESLHLDGNKITSIKVEWFDLLENLKKLYLQSNEIEDLPKNSFSYLKNLTEIDLSDNMIKVIHSHSFPTHHNLDVVIFANNKIHGIDKYFISNTRVSHFDVRNNVCVNKNISDTSITREFILDDLKECFAKYRILKAGCTIGDFDGRVCTIEKENDEINENLKDLNDENDRINMVTEELQRQINTLEEKKEDMESQMNQLRLIVKNQNVMITKLEEEIKAFKINLKNKFEKNEYDDEL